MIIEPLAQIKSADSRQNFSQGALDEVGYEPALLIPVYVLGGLAMAECLIWFFGWSTDQGGRAECAARHGPYFGDGSH
jgi:hypothetical protein